MMTNQSRVVLYTGITNSLMRRVWLYQSGEIEGFTEAFKVNHLAHHGSFDDPRDTVAHEREIKGWPRQEKNALIGTESGLGGLSPALFQQMKGPWHALAARAERQ